MYLNVEFIEKLESYISQGLVTKRKHEKFPLYILKYTRDAQLKCSDKNDPLVWDEVLLSCRGLVIDENYKVIAQPFKKFFNQEEHTLEYLTNYQNKGYVIQEKVDGSLIIIFNYENEWVLATQKSFYSDVAIYAKEFFYANKDKYNLNKDYLYLCELVSPMNRVVVNYGADTNLILLAVKDQEFNELNLESLNTKMTLVKEYTNLKLNELKSLNIENQEGFVVKFSDGFRYKVKFENYLKLHYILTGLSAKEVYKIMSSGQNVEELVINNDTPDEFDSWVINIKNIYMNWYYQKEKEIIQDYNFLNKFIQENPNITKKEIVEYLNIQQSYGIVKNKSYLLSNYHKETFLEDLKWNKQNKYVWGYVNDLRLNAQKDEKGLLPVSFFSDKGFEFEE